MASRDLFFFVFLVHNVNTSFGSQSGEKALDLLRCQEFVDGEQTIAVGVFSTPHFLGHSDWVKLSSIVGVTLKPSRAHLNF